MRHFSRHVLAIAFVLLAMVIAGCGGSSNPATPTNPTSSPTSGAVITGTVLGSSVGARAADSTGGGMTVSVVGTNITVTVGLTGQFTIPGVPAGDITLKFHGVGGDATVTVTQVTQGETINITVTIQGTTATAETETRESSGLMQVEGRIQSIDTAAKSFVVAGKTITTDGSTTFSHGSQTYVFADLQAGWRVHVAGTSASGGVLATRVEVQNTNGDIQANVNGIVATVTGTASAFQFYVGTTLVKGDAATTFSGKSKFADLVNGARVEVKGQQKNGYVYATSIHVN
jgi:Domain of unknown function (DUF5666)